MAFIAEKTAFPRYALPSSAILQVISRS